MWAQVSEAHPLVTMAPGGVGGALPDWGSLGGEPRRPFLALVFDARGRFTSIPDIN